MSFAKRIGHLRAEGAYAVLAKAQSLEAQGREIIHLEIGQPDVPTFGNVAQAGIRAIQEGHTRYNPPAGVVALREAIAEDAGQRRGIEVQPSQVVVGPGAKPALFFPTLALVRPGDEVIYPDPGFPTYAAMIGVAGGVPVPVPLREETDFAFDLDVFDRVVNERTRMIVLNSPSNPTGGVLSDQVQEHVALGDAAARAAALDGGDVDLFFGHQSAYAGGQRGGTFWQGGQLGRVLGHRPCRGVLCRCRRRGCRRRGCRCRGCRFSRRRCF